MSDLLAPSDEAGVAAAISAAHAAGEPLAVVGRGSKAALLRPVQAARTLSAANLAGITLYSPSELIIAARAGTTLAEIEAAVAAKGQHIVSEPPDFTALFGRVQPQTIGGVVGANLSGPRRVAWGAMRDHVMGIRAVNGTGETIRSGGRVLKNVTGLDLCKLFTGSHGTLGVLTEVTLKVAPAPEQRATLALRGLDPARAVAALSAALGSPFAVSAAAYLPAAMAGFVPGIGAGPVALARIEDFAPSVAYRCERLRADLAAFGAAEILDDAASRLAWAAIRDAMPMAGMQGAIWRVSVRPSRGPAVAAALEAAFGAAWFLDWGGGLVWVAGPATAEAHAEVVAAAARHGGTHTLFRAPEALRAAVDVVPREAAPLAAITRRVKAAFDPKGILNPGRMHAGL
jgi:glycolate oxidase FAD binding subunit